MLNFLIFIFASFFATASFAQESIGEINTAFKLIGPDHKIVVEVFDDPLVQGVSCYVSRAKKGGVSGALGFASDPSEMSIACRQVGAISFKSKLEPKEEVFSERISFLFKHLRVIRLVDSRRKVLIYLTISDKLIDGSPQNSVTAVPVGSSIPVK